MGEVIGKVCKEDLRVLYVGLSHGCKGREGIELTDAVENLFVFGPGVRSEAGQPPSDCHAQANELDRLSGLRLEQTAAPRGNDGVTQQIRIVRVASGSL